VPVPDGLAEKAARRAVTPASHPQVRRPLSRDRARRPLRLGRGE
jgi:hypothetical protein